MKYLTKVGVKLINETTKTKGDILQGIARKHFKLITRGRKDSEAAKRLRAAYQQNEEEENKKPKIKLSNLQNLPHPGQGIGKQTGNTNLSRNNPGYEERMEGHQTRMDNRRKVNRKMKRDVNEGFKNWLKKKLGEDTTVPRKKWNPVPKAPKGTPLGTDARLEPRRANRGYVNPKGGKMTTEDPRTGLPMIVVKGVTREDAKRNER